MTQGIVYFDTNVLGWKPVVEVWLSIRNPQEAQCLRKYFQQIMDSIVDYFTHKSRYALYYTILAYVHSTQSLRVGYVHSTQSLKVGQHMSIGNGVANLIV